MAGYSFNYFVRHATVVADVGISAFKELLELDELLSQLQLHCDALNLEVKTIVSGTITIRTPTSFYKRDAAAVGDDGLIATYITKHELVKRGRSYTKLVRYFRNEVEWQRARTDAAALRQLAIESTAYTAPSSLAISIPQVTDDVDPAAHAASLRAHGRRVLETSSCSLSRSLATVAATQQVSNPVLLSCLHASCLPLRYVLK